MRLTIKLGGSILEDQEIRRGILLQVAELFGAGHEIILVHGGGKSLSRRLAQLGLQSEFVGGLRVTDAPVLVAAVMVLAGEVNKKLVAELDSLGQKAVGICGADAAAVRCAPLSDLPGCPKNLGFVGRPLQIERQFFELLLHQGLLPVVASLALGPASQIYNVNADQMAAICAWGTASQALLFLTDVPGVRDHNGTVMPRIDQNQIQDLRAQGILSGGMVPKTASCLEALEHGVQSVYILPGAARQVLRDFVSGGISEGTCIYGNC